MKNPSRLRELQDYAILNTTPEKELDELTEIASAICGTPISLLSFVDENRQWFKSRKGLEVEETPRDQAFCAHALDHPEEVLVVSNPLGDPRFKDNPLVTGDPKIRFYAGAPLVTQQGNVLGTLCVIDQEERDITENQKRALQLLARKAMDYLDARKLILKQDENLEHSAKRLKKLTDMAPGAIFQFKMDQEGKMWFPFLSKGFSQIHPNLDPESLRHDASAAFDHIHPEDVERVRQAMIKSFHELTPWDEEYRTTADDRITWHWGKALPHQNEDGSVTWNGTFQDVTQQKEYAQTLEEIIHDVSHVMRRPITTMLGLTELSLEEDNDRESLMEYATHLRSVALEMEQYTRKLDKVYNQKSSDAKDFWFE